VAREFAVGGCVCRGRGNLQSVGDLAGVGDVCRGSQAFAVGGEVCGGVLYAGDGGVFSGWG